jgi:hypothetical protein
MNYCIYSADRATHLKIVALALVASIGVAGLGIAARIGSNGGYAQNARLIKAGQPALAEGALYRCSHGRSSCAT